MSRSFWSGVLTAILAASLLSGCRETQPGGTVQRPGQAPVTFVKDDDPKMQAAIDKARSTADQFIAALGNPKPAQTGFAVKAAIKDGDNVEHMWLTPVRFESGEFIGSVNNEPVKVSTVKLGDEVKIAKGQISDWMYVENGRLIGGHTIRAIRDNMPPAERAKFEASIGLILD